MLEPEKFLQCGYSVVFPRRTDVRPEARSIEGLLGEHYHPPQTLEGPDELDPNIPRLVFGAKNGFAQLLVSQVGVSFNLTFPPEWQRDVAVGRAYLEEQAGRLFSLLERLGEKSLSFSGLTSRVQLSWKGTEHALLACAVAHHFGGKAAEFTYDLEWKQTLVHDERFFGNLTFQNYRTWNLAAPPVGLLRLQRAKAAEFGIQIQGDWNDRYAWNEISEYRTTREVGLVVISRGIEEMTRAAARIREEFAT